MATYVRWYWPDDDTWNYEELDADRQPLRHVEVRHRDGAALVAASLTELLASRDAGGLGAVRAYETRYGVVPVGPLPHASTEYPLEAVDRQEFEALWETGRRWLDE